LTPAIPVGFFAPGPIDPRLPFYIGQIVMLSALLDKDVAAMAAAVGTIPDQNAYLASDVTQNIRVCLERFPRYSEPWQVDAIERARPILDEIAILSNERNEIVHRVWSIAVGDAWGGYKGSRSKDPRKRDAERDAGWGYSPKRMEEIIDRMVTCADRGRDVVPLIVGLPRLAESSG
jgi:hypothetical protein